MAPACLPSIADPTTVTCNSPASHCTRIVGNSPAGTDPRQVSGSRRAATKRASEHCCRRYRILHRKVDSWATNRRYRVCGIASAEQVVYLPALGLGARCY
jgi:hypothetical protein